MSEDMQREVYKALRDAQDKYVYFLLAAVGAAVAFSLSQTNGAKLAWSHLPLGGALLLWAASFVAGCRHLQYAQSTLYANAEYFRVLGGEHPHVGANPRIMAAAAGITDAAEENSSRAGKWGRWQFRLFVAGCLAYVAWHILEMYFRSLS